jgi:hypothetical protein
VYDNSAKIGKLWQQEAVDCTVPIEKLRVGIANGRVNFERKRHLLHTTRSNLGQDVCSQIRVSDFGRMIQEDVPQSNGVQVGAMVDVNALTS